MTAKTQKERRIGILSYYQYEDGVDMELLVRKNQKGTYEIVSYNQGSQRIQEGELDTLETQMFNYTSYFNSYMEDLRGRQLTLDELNRYGSQYHVREVEVKRLNPTTEKEEYHTLLLGCIKGLETPAEKQKGASKDFYVTLTAIDPEDEWDYYVVDIRLKTNEEGITVSMGNVQKVENTETNGENDEKVYQEIGRYIPQKATEETDQNIISYAENIQIARQVLRNHENQQKQEKGNEAE